MKSPVQQETEAPLSSGLEEQRGEGEEKALGS